MSHPKMPMIPHVSHVPHLHHDPCPVGRCLPYTHILSPIKKQVGVPSPRCYGQLRRVSPSQGRSHSDDRRGRHVLAEMLHSILYRRLDQFVDVRTTHLSKGTKNQRLESHLPEN